MVQDEARRLARWNSVAGSPTATIDGFAVLDIYAGGVSDEAPRVEALATISAGYRARGEGNPQRSTDGTIYLHDATNRAPGLRRALELRQNKALTIAFPFDDPASFIHCRFMRYSATELQAFGDETHLMVLVPGKGYERVEAGTDAYAEWLMGCKVSVSVYFCLAEWGPDGPEIVFPDGVGAYYRLRFTSRNSLRSILAGLRSIGQFTNGRIAGVPFDLALDYREVADPTGKKRTIPVWTIATKPPGGKRLTSRNFSETMTLALDQGAALMLPAPSEPTFEDAQMNLDAYRDEDLDESIVEGVVVEPSDRELSLIARGGRCNEASWRAMFFSAVRHSELDGEESPARAAWLREYTNGVGAFAGRTDSLAEFLHWATEKEAQAMVVAAADYLALAQRQRAERGEPPLPRQTPQARRSYADLFPDGEDGDPKGAAHGPVASTSNAATTAPSSDAAAPAPVVEEPPFRYASVEERDAAAAEYDRLARLAEEKGHKHAKAIKARRAADLADQELAVAVDKLQLWESKLPTAEQKPELVDAF